MLLSVFCIGNCSEVELFLLPLFSPRLIQILVCYYWLSMCCAGKMSLHTAFCLPLLCGMLMLATADLEHTQHAGHVQTAHEVGGEHNVEFDHEAILGVLLISLSNNCVRL